MIRNAPGTAPVLDRLRGRPSGQKLARTLAASRYIDFPDGNSDNDWRRRTSQAIRGGATNTQSKLAAWRLFALALAGPENESSPNLLIASQQSRLLINLSGGVFENGGLNLDRLSGLPVIPGTAVKGCARRLALSALQEWTSGLLQPEDPENLLAPAVEGFKGPSDLLFNIALVFGCGALEWQGREDFDSDQKWQQKRPDFAWAGGSDWQEIRRDAANRLCEHFHVCPKEKSKPWKSLPHFAGTVSFLPAYPWECDPGIDLDVLTCHHGEYYKGSTQLATDTEEPVPVIFPAIAPGQNWGFLLKSMPHGCETLLKHARNWLAHGLEIFGLGAKTNAGYGVFVVPDLEDLRRKQLEKIEAIRLQREAELEQRRKDERAAANAHLLAIKPETELLERFSTFNEQQLRAAINKFHFEEKFWPQGPSEEATESYQVSLFIFVTETNRSLYDQEKSKPKSKVMTAIRKLAEKYARTLPE